MIYWESRGTCRRYADVPLEATIVEVHGRECFGLCEICRKPVLDGQQFHMDGEGIFWHDKCGRQAGV